MLATAPVTGPKSSKTIGAVTAAPAAVAARAIVVDNTSAFRMKDGIPLVVPEVNPEQIHKHIGIIANPNCSTIIMNVPVWPLHKINRVKRIIVSTSVTLVTTNDPVKIAEDYAMLQHLSKGRMDLMVGRGNTVPVYPWFGKDIREGVALALENYNLLHRLWREDDEVNDQGEVIKKGEWKQSASFGKDDLLLLAKIADFAHTWIYRRIQDDRHEESF